MNHFKGLKKTKSYFEGWYFKQQKDNDTIAFIPGINLEKSGEKFAFIQVITNEFSSFISFPYQDFSCKDDSLCLKIGKSEFSSFGIKINIESELLNIFGNITFLNLTPIQSNIMGPFRFFPFMQCNHSIISLSHFLQGHIQINGKQLDLNGGRGYIEKDYGVSFPKFYTWIQCNDFKKNNCCISVSIADVPFLGINFKGCIGIVYFNAKEYRFATYKGVQIIRCDNNKIILKQKNYYLEIDIYENVGKHLYAPENGQMNRKIKETNNCAARFRFSLNGTVIFDEISNNTSFEYVI